AGTGAIPRNRRARSARVALQIRAGGPLRRSSGTSAPRKCASAHLIQLRARSHLLREQRGLDAVKQAFEPADELRVRDTQLGITGNFVVGERQRDAVELF